MARTRNKKILKLRKYRDKLLVLLSEKEKVLREQQELFSMIRMALTKDEHLRAYTLAQGDDDPDLQGFRHLNNIIKELVIVIRYLAVERTYTQQLDDAVDKNDWLRAKALCSQHKEETKSHDLILSEMEYRRGVSTKELLRSLDDVA